MLAHLEELRENFSLFDDWEDRYRYLIDLGRTLPHLPDSFKINDNIVRGCTSRVWMTAEIKNGIFYLQADSDAHIVRGLIALLIAAYHKQTIESVKNIDMNAFFSAIGLDTHLSPNRRNGFFSMVERIKSLTHASTLKS